MRNGNLSNQDVSDHAKHSAPKLLGVYLIEAGLISPAQLQVALNDQKTSSMRVGEILVARGWVKEQTVEYLMQKVVIPERQTVRVAPDAQERFSRSFPSSPESSKAKKETSWMEPIAPRKAPKESRLTWGELPVSQPLPAGEESDDDVRWNG
ncbi:MAG: hypothetical protein SFW36_12225 [Leptolyngbyaceae cyanobacterium bins.59]|nr:hypothetical protein [Leptolyngbyaceae cyanobacterium bins.59]